MCYYSRIKGIHVNPPITKKKKILFILWQMNTQHHPWPPRSHSTAFVLQQEKLPFPDTGEPQDPISFPQIQGPFSFFNNPLEIRTQVSCLAQPCRRESSICTASMGKTGQWSPCLGGWLNSQSLLQVRLSEGARSGPRVQLPGLPSRNLQAQIMLQHYLEVFIGPTTSFSLQLTILPSQTLLPCAQVSSCHPEAWLRPGSPGICMAVAVKSEDIILLLLE